MVVVRRAPAIGSVAICVRQLWPALDVVTERPERFFYTGRTPLFTDRNAKLSRKSFEAFRRTIHPDMLWNPFVLRITRELERFGRAYEAGKRPKLAISTAPQMGKSMAAEDFAAWMSGRQPNKKTIYASYSEDLGTRMSVNLQRLMVSRRYREVFPHIMVGVPGWIANTNMTEFARYNGSFRSTTINGPITGLELNLGILDDYAKGRAEANSKLNRDKIWSWFADDFLTRFAKDSQFKKGWAGGPGRPDSSAVLTVLQGGPTPERPRTRP
jgi:hypothetical protein